MSLLDFQKALAHVIRGQKINENLSEELLLTFNLSFEEKSLIKEFSKHPWVCAYSQSNAHFRLDLSLPITDFLFAFLNKDIVEKLWHDFDTSNLSVSEFKAGLEFLYTLYENKQFKDIINKNSQEYVIDIIKFLYCVYYYTSDEAIEKFKIISIEHDIREICDIILKKQHNKNYYKDLKFKNPSKRKLDILFVGDLNTMNFRSFEIDEESKNFLMNPSHKKPKTYEELKALGLCY